ncbi:MAG TPA: 50S ribosomal protein L19 [Oscillatoriales bacterium UBA8482]|jgi:large subunit ribosomal protein L19|nr:MAG: 50S ribosomal protein L19 [Oscillatoriales cyanobacterium CG2_30_40_61]HBW58261.1 50S ribosomal protein L19 [Oscillatoriales bacterium UBA8482]
MKAGEIIRSIETEEIESLRQQLNKPDLPDIYVGDTIRVGVKIQEGGKERIQPYEGVVIAKRHGSINATITVRKIFQGVGVERVFLIHSPRIANIKVIRRGKVRRAKLFYLRDRIGKATRVKQRFDRSL